MSSHDQNALRQIRLLRCRERFVAHRVERHAGRQHQALLSAADGDIDAPLVMTVVRRGERGDGVDEEQRRMAGAIDRLADVGDRRQASGRGLVVQHAHRLDLVGFVFAQLGLDGGGIGTDAPIGRDELGLEAELHRHVLPQGGELAGLDHQHAVACRQGVDECGFPRPGARRGVDDDRVCGLENRLDAFEDALGKFLKLGTAVVDNRRVHRAQNAVRHRGRPRDLEKVAAGGA